MTEHTHTDKTLQGNDKIESAIAALQQEPSQEIFGSRSDGHPQTHE